jgi:hypothetical protein
LERVEVVTVIRLNRRRSLAGTILVIATALSVVAATTVTAAPSRASSRWNHVAKAPTNLSTTSTDAGTEPAIKHRVWKTIHVVEHYSSRFTFVDVAPKGDSPGDYGVFKDPVFSRGGVRVGTIDVQCIAAYSDQCSGSVRLPGRGQITFAGITPLGSDPDHFAVTGGTGHFAGVGGTLVIEFPNFDEAKLIITLIR